MISTFTWLDHSESDRRRMLDLIERFREAEARDELGFGVIQNAFSDMFFPGTSTIQTRARYFLLVPWIFLSLEEKRVGSDRISDRTRGMEAALIGTLLASGETSGVIGSRSRSNLRRMPSSIYWQGLRDWRICLFPGSQYDYYRSLDAHYSSARRSRARTDDGEPLDDLVRRNWHSGLPDVPDDLLGDSSLELDHAEARYLRERIQESNPRSLLAAIVGLDDPGAWSDAPWSHPEYARFPDHLKRQLRHARAFSEAAYGATLLYNLMLSELNGAREDVEERGRELREWAVSPDLRDSLDGWERTDFWELVLSEGANVSVQTRSFVDSWLDVALEPDRALSVASDEAARDLIRDRERARKRAQARLTNPRALELWSGASGLYRLSYRWGSAHAILSDIAHGLNGEDDA